VKFRQQPSRSSSLLFLFAYFHFLSLLNTEFNFNAAARARLFRSLLGAYFSSPRAHKKRKTSGRQKSWLSAYGIFTCLCLFDGSSERISIALPANRFAFLVCRRRGKPYQESFEQLFSPRPLVKFGAKNIYEVALCS
jgi:hypothetical protein